MPDRRQFFRDFTAAFNARDIEAVIAYCAPDVGFHTPLAEYHGHDGLRKWQRDFDEAWGDEIRGEATAYLERGEQTLVCYLLRGRGSHSGMEVAMENAAIGRWRDGVLADLRVYLHKDEALAELGASAHELIPYVV